MLRALFNSFRKNYYYIYLIVSILAVYFLLQGILYVYIGLIDPRGDIHSDMLARYSLIQFYLEGLIHPTRLFLEMLGYTSRYSTNNHVGILHGSGVQIAHGCLGLNIIIAYSSLLVPLPGRKKILFWVYGMAGIYLFNLTRVIAIILFNQKVHGFISLAHEGFNLIGYCFIFGIFYIWYKNYSSLNTIQ